MKRVLDEGGKVIKHLYRSETGLLLVDDKAGIAEYQRKMKETQRVRELESEIDELKSMVKILLEKQNG